MNRRGSALLLSAQLLLLPLRLACGTLVISELHYNPPDDGLTAGGWREFVELYNRGGEAVDLAGYGFADGIEFSFPAGARLGPGAYLVVARDPSHSVWSDAAFPVFGPYAGALDDGGEQVALIDPAGRTAAALQYGDDPPWPRGPDGYGSSLELIAPELPAGSPYSWRASRGAGGTPGRASSVAAIPPFPVLDSFEIDPPWPRSTDEVAVRVALRAPHAVDAVSLQWEPAGGEGPALVRARATWRYWPGSTAPAPGLEWADPDFDDSGWAAGEGGFGYGDTEQLRTVLDDMRYRYRTVFIRHRFLVEDPAAAGRLTLSLYVDDGFACFLNGRRVADDRAPASLAHDALATGSHESDTISMFDLGEGAELLRQGENVLALVGFNVDLTSTDFVLAPTLLAESGGRVLPMAPVAQTSDITLFGAQLPRLESQTLVRMNVRVELAGGLALLLPDDVEPNPFLSYFVYDGEVESLLPILWVLPPTASGILTAPRRLSGIVCLRQGRTHPDCFDAAELRAARSGDKVRFIKGAEFYGDRTINLIPEIPTGGTNAGVSAPFREHLGYWFYRELGVLSPWSQFHRVIRLPASAGLAQAQRLVVQQVNEQMLLLNGRDPDGDLYKRVYSDPNWEKHTNKEEGSGSIERLVASLATGDAARRRQAMETQLVLPGFLAYSVASVLSSNWDGFWNNNWMHLDPAEGGKWEIIPWDLDWLWGSTTQGMYWTMPVTFPIDGVATGGTQASRPPGPVTAPLHRDREFHRAYLRLLRYEMDRHFDYAYLSAEIDRQVALLVADLSLMERQTGSARPGRAAQIEQGYEEIRTFIARRRSYLEQALPPVREVWEAY